MGLIRLAIFRKLQNGCAAMSALRCRGIELCGKTYDRYGRLLATCYSRGINLSEEIVRQGWAMAYRAYSEDYVAAEIEARNAKRGMWAGKFEPPWEWRRRGK